MVPSAIIFVLLLLGNIHTSTAGAVMPNFTISAPPETDAWRVPPSTNIFNAPTHALIPSPAPLKSFQSARITLTANWTTLYDHGGLLFHLTDASGNGQDQWVKTGMEWYQDQPYISTVATDNYADWSIFPTASSGVTIEARREESPGLWIYQIVKKADGSEERRTLREVTWFFAKEDEDEDEAGWMLDVRAMAARPATEDKVVGAEKELVVEFEDAEVVFR
ncbi:hypothetical protein V5O48_002352 [Marasmius crinis-equi]|uniref:Uncharacterized protein n=1 Tax=Marasmius crinis-equi TaxID=585013 RepID=A0ABR3FVV0_9AGAR